MAYQSLEKLFHMDASSKRFENNVALAASRREAESSFKTSFEIGGEELFLATPRELSLLNETILGREREIAVALSDLPAIARGALIRGLVIDEVVCSNELEGVYSTRRQINELLETMPVDSSKLSHRRFRELARLYLELSDNSHVLPQTPEDIRRIYDRIMSGEELGEDAPDGTLFRKGEVSIIGDGGRVIHQGLSPESRIISALSQMIGLASSPDIPGTYRAAASHFIFEYTHPFYDGNGRTGRYLLALYLSRPLSTLTALSLSRAIAENRNPYYRAFREVEHPLNHGELTPFVIMLLQYVDVAQQRILSDLEIRGSQFQIVRRNLERLSEQEPIPDKQRDLLFMLAQFDLFGAFPDVPIEGMEKYLGLRREMTRKHVRALEERGLTKKVSGRPLRFALTEKGETLLGIGDA